MATLLKQKGSKFWHLMWWQDGKKRWRSTGTDDDALAARALEELKAVLAGERQQERMRSVLEFAGKIKVEAAKVPLASIWEVFTKQPAQRDIQPATLRSKHQKVEKFRKWMNERHPEIRSTHEVTERLAAEYMGNLSRKAGQTRNNTLSALRGIWDALRIPLGIGNPWMAVKRVEARHVAHKAFTDKQVRDIFGKAVERNAASQDSDGFWPTAIAIGYYTGLRFGDVCELSWDEVDFEKCRLVVLQNKDRKKVKPVVHPFRKEFAEILAKRWEAMGKPDEGFVWPEMAKMYKSSSRELYGELGELFKAAGIKTRRKAVAADGARVEEEVKEYGFHSLRATFATVLTDAGAMRSDIQDLIGHSSLEMTAHYSKSTAAGARVAKLVPGLGEANAETKQ